MLEGKRKAILEERDRDRKKVEQARERRAQAHAAKCLMKTNSLTSRPAEACYTNSDDAKDRATFGSKSSDESLPLISTAGVLSEIASISATRATTLTSVC